MKHIWTRRHMLGLLGSVGFGMMGGAPAFAQAGNGLLEKARKEGVMRIGLTSGLPYAFMHPDGRLDGVAPTIVRTVLERLGIPRVEGTVVTYGQLIPGLQAGRWDMIGADMSITKDRCAQVAFCDPFTIDYSAYVHLPEFTDPPKTLKDMGARKIKVGLLAGTYNLKVIQAVYDKPDDYITTYPDTAAIMDAITAKRVQMGASGVRSIRQLLSQKPDVFKYVYPMPDDIIAPASAAFRPTDTDLIVAFKAEFQKLKKSGEWEKILNQFTFEVFPGKENVTAEEACSGSV